MNINAIISMAAAVGRHIEAGKRTIAELRSIIARESPQDLPEFDARVAAARKPSQEAADAATAENATIGAPDHGGS